jgi:hypothetical protein
MEADDDPDDASCARRSRDDSKASTSSPRARRLSLPRRLACWGILRRIATRRRSVTAGSASTSPGIRPCPPAQPAPARSLPPRPRRRRIPDGCAGAAPGAPRSSPGSRMRIERGQYDQAVASMRESTGSHSASAIAQIRMGRLLQLTGNSRRDRVLRGAVVLDPGSASARFELGLASRERDLDGAIESSPGDRDRPAPRRRPQRPRHVPLPPGRRRRRDRELPPGDRGGFPERSGPLQPGPGARGSGGARSRDRAVSRGRTAGPHPCRGLDGPRTAPRTRGRLEGRDRLLPQGHGDRARERCGPFRTRTRPVEEAGARCRDRELCPGDRPRRRQRGVPASPRSLVQPERGWQGRDRWVPQGARDRSGRRRRVQRPRDRPGGEG